MINSSKYIYVNFEDINTDLVTRNANFKSIYKVYPILEKSSDYVVSVTGFTIPLNAMPNILDIKKINIKTNTIPVKPTVGNTQEQIQQKTLYTYYPFETELKSSILSVNVQNPIYHTLESTEQLVNVDLYIEIIYNSTPQNLRLAAGSICNVDIQFKHSYDL